MEDRIFTKKVTLTTKYTPERLIGRDVEINEIASLLLPATKGDAPDNAFIYGKTGVGKTATVKFVLSELDHEVKSANVKSVFMNCTQTNTTIRIIRRICNVVAPEVDVPVSGLATSEYYQRLWNVLNDFDGITIVVLDEVDKLNDDNILYNLSRANENLDITKGFISVLGISNDITYKERLDARTLSSFGDTEFNFAPYNADQLRDILEDRVRHGFKEGVLDNEVIPLCASLAAREHGDARKALMLLEGAGKMAVMRDGDRVIESDVRDAQKRIETDRADETIKTLPYHQKLILHVIALHGNGGISTNEVYGIYQSMAGTDALSKKRVSGLISELDILGLVSARMVYRGQKGRFRLVNSNVRKEKIHELLGVEQ
jgi:cell division control protein 6